MNEKIMKLDKEIVSEIILQNRCYSSLTQLCEFGTRFAGTPGEKMARDYIVAELKSCGLNATVEPFEHLGWRRKTARLQILEPINREVQTISLAGAPSTPAGGIEGVVVYVGNGTPAEFNRAKNDVKDKIVISTSLSPAGECSPPRQCHRRTKYGRAVEFGARAFIFMNSQAGMLPQTGSTRQNKAGEIPAVTIPFEEGEMVKHFLQKGPVKVRMEVENESFTNRTGNIVAELQGKNKDEVVIIGGHYDSHDIATGAGDNGAGVVTILELAKILTRVGAQFEKTIRFVFFGVEEMASVGSAFYVRDHKEELDTIHLFMNIDGQGSPGGKTFDTQGFDDLSDYILSVSKEMNYPMNIPSPSFSGDSISFVMGGVPTAALKKSGTPGMFDFRGTVQTEDRGWGHTSADTLDKITPFRLLEGAIIAGRVLVRAADHRGRIAKYRNKQETDEILEKYGMDEVARYMQWPTIAVAPKY